MKVKTRHWTDEWNISCVFNKIAEGVKKRRKNTALLLLKAESGPELKRQELKG
jgi:hypothetical protein